MSNYTRTGWYDASTSTVVPGLAYVNAGRAAQKNVFEVMIRVIYSYKKLRNTAPPLPRRSATTLRLRCGEIVARTPRLPVVVEPEGRGKGSGMQERAHKADFLVLETYLYVSCYSPS